MTLWSFHVLQAMPYCRGLITPVLTPGLPVIVLGLVPPDPGPGSTGHCVSAWPMPTGGHRQGRFLDPSIGAVCAGGSLMP
jgi:hypothetical protein